MHNWQSRRGNNSWRQPQWRSLRRMSSTRCVVTHTITRTHTYVRTHTHTHTYTHTALGVVRCLCASNFVCLLQRKALEEAGDQTADAPKLNDIDDDAVLIAVPRAPLHAHGQVGGSMWRCDGLVWRLYQQPLNHVWRRVTALCS
jgi:hypothetical protein